MNEEPIFYPMVIILPCIRHNKYFVGTCYPDKNNPIIHVNLSEKFESWEVAQLLGS